MNDSLKKNGEEYDGTDPVADAKKIFLEVQYKNLKQSRENIYIDDEDGVQEVEATDPYEVFGFGVLAYFQMLRFLMVAMAMMTVVTFPLIYKYSQGQVMENIFDDFISSTRLSIGNLG